MLQKSTSQQTDIALMRHTDGLTTDIRRLNAVYCSKSQHLGNQTLH